MNKNVSMHDVFMLYSCQSIGTKIFIRLRHILSPLMALENHIPIEGNLLDLGCGHGLFTNYMALKSSRRNIIGIDPAEPKIKVARGTESAVPNVRYILGEIHDLSSNKLFDVITIVDVLYLLSERKQREIINICYGLLNKSARLILKTSITTQSWRFKWTYFQEKIMVNLKLTLGDKNLIFLPVQKIIKILEETGFIVEQHHFPANTFYPSVVLICRK